MPLIPGNHPSVISQNIRELRNAGHPENQAIAIAMHTAHHGSPPAMHTPKHKKSGGAPHGAEEPMQPIKGKAPRPAVAPPLPAPIGPTASLLGR
jgi:hypothetical protein